MALEFNWTSIPRNKHSRGQADLALASSLEHNRSLKNVERMDKAIDWSRVQTILMSHYTIGTSNEDADVYPIEFEDHSMRAYPALLIETFAQPNQNVIRMTSKLSCLL